MPRRMSEAREKEFEELSSFLEFYSTKVTGIDREDRIHPSNVLVKIIDKFGKSKALEGLKQAINDTIEDSLELTSSQVSEIDVELSKEKLVTLSELRVRYFKKYRKIVERKVIRNETEYYLISAIVSDLSSSISNEERESLNELVCSYEKNA